MALSYKKNKDNEKLNWRDERQTGIEWSRPYIVFHGSTSTKDEMSPATKVGTMRNPAASFASVSVEIF